MKGKKGNPSKGDKVTDSAPSDVYAGGNSNVIKEAKRKRGGKVDGGPPKKNFGRPGRKSGGRIGSDTAPLSSAARGSSAVGHKTDNC